MDGRSLSLMVKDCGAHIVELGHSERRTFFNETDETVALKVAAAVKHGLIALVCIGDTRSEYDAGATADVLAKQTRYALRDVGKSARGQVIIAYEPVWSIGEGGVPADPDFANEQHKRIKAITAEIVGEPLPVLYGGSVNPQNCCDLAARSDIDGLFIGRSAWDPSGYIGIIEAVTAALGEQS
jgi:L-erythrulose 1-phosphate isomerase